MEKYIDKKPFDKNEWQRNQRKKNGNSYTKKYERTWRGYIMRMYRNMKSRIEGVQKNKAHLYHGKSLLSKEEFYEFANNSSMFSGLFYQYWKSGYNQKKAPTVDRIDSSKGYELGNIEFVTMSVNSRRGTISKVIKYGQKPAKLAEYIN